MQIYDSPQEIEMFRKKALIGAIKLEIAGMKRRGRSAYSIAKEEYNLTGNKQNVLKQLQQLYTKQLEKRN